MDETYHVKWTVNTVDGRETSHLYALPESVDVIAMLVSEVNQRIRDAYEGAAKLLVFQNPLGIYNPAHIVRIFSQAVSPQNLQETVDDAQRTLGFLVPRPE